MYASASASAVSVNWHRWSRDEACKLAHCCLLCHHNWCNPSLVILWGRGEGTFKPGMVEVHDIHSSLFPAALNFILYMAHCGILFCWLYCLEVTFQWIFNWNVACYVWFFFVGFIYGLELQTEIINKNDFS